MVKQSAFARLKAAEVPAPLPTSATVGVQSGKQANRIGKKTVIFYDAPEAVRELKRLAVDQDRTMQDMLHEALDDLLMKYGKHAFGKR